jgi:hypothetical protein
MKSRTWLCLLLLAVACSQDEVATTDDLWLYANRFFDEAETRNIHLDKSTLSIRFVDKREIIPYAGYGESNPPRVRIATQYWYGYTEVQKEILMFHELGHAMLARQHTNEMLSDCIHYKSMMLAGNQFVVYDRLDDEKREYYIDELFDPSTKSPSWIGTPKPNRISVLQNVTDGWEFFAVDGSTNTAAKEDDGSLHIHGVTGTGDSYWQLSLPSNGLLPGAVMTVTFTVKTANITGGGASVTFHPDLTKNQQFWTSTALYYTLNGTHDWQTLQLTLNCYPDDKPPMFLYLSLVGTASGDVWFKNVSVDYYN